MTMDYLGMTTTWTYLWELLLDGITSDGIATLWIGWVIDQASDTVSRLRSQSSSSRACAGFFCLLYYDRSHQLQVISVSDWWGVGREQVSTQARIHKIHTQQVGEHWSWHSTSITKMNSSPPRRFRKNKEKKAQRWKPTPSQLLFFQIFTCNGIDIVSGFSPYFSHTEKQTKEKTQCNTKSQTKL